MIAQKCPQEGRVGRREAAARGCPRRQQSGLGFVQVSCPLEHTSNSAASVCLLPMAARLQPASPPAASHCRLLPFPGRALYAPGLVPGSDSGTTQGHTHRTTGLFGLTAPEIAQKCPQASTMGRREAAARGCPRRPGGGLGRNAGSAHFCGPFNFESPTRRRLLRTRSGSDLRPYWAGRCRLWCVSVIGTTAGVSPGPGRAGEHAARGP